MPVRYNVSLIIVILLSIAAGCDLKAQSNTGRSVLLEKNLVSGEPYESRRFPVERSTELSIVTFSGNVEVYENPAIDYIQIDLYVDRGFTLWSGSTSLDNYHIIFREMHHKIVATVEPKRSESKVWKSDNISFSYVVQTPVSVTSRIRNTKGDIWVRNIRGNHLIQTTIGDLYLENLEGETSAFSANGNIFAENIRGAFNAKTINGDISAHNSQGEIRVKALSGSIKTTGLNGTFIASTASGDIDAELISAGEGSFIETFSGSVILTLKQDLDHTIQISGSSVDVTDLLNRAEFEGNVQRRNANLVFGNGKIPIQISSLSGNVTVKTSSN